VAFMVLSLALATAGTARFVVALGYPAEIGYAVGTIFDLAKGVLPVSLGMLAARRAFVRLALLGLAWVGLVILTGLATSATVGSAIAALERNAAWGMETRGNATSELASVDQRLRELSKPAPPRPAAAIAQALLREHVPAGIWRDSQECANIRTSRHFQKECANVLRQRQELAAAKEYERLEARARELRHALSTMAILAIEDQLPRAFAATLGRVVPVDAHFGVALLLTLVIEIISCFGLAAVRALRTDTNAASASGNRFWRLLGTSATATRSAAKIVLEKAVRIIPGSLNSGRAATASSATSIAKKEAPPNPLSLPTKGGSKRTRRVVRQARRRPVARSNSNAHVRDFARARLVARTGRSLSVPELRAAYADWCRSQGLAPLSQQKLGAELTLLGFGRWKSCGLIRYRDVQLAVACEITKTPLQSATRSGGKAVRQNHALQGSGVAPVPGGGSAKSRNMGLGHCSRCPRL
jgi:hypothetical protein